MRGIRGNRGARSVGHLCSCACIGLPPHHPPTMYAVPTRLAHRDKPLRRHATPMLKSIHCRKLPAIGRLIRCYAHANMHFLDARQLQAIRTSNILHTPFRVKRQASTAEQPWRPQHAPHQTKAGAPATDTGHYKNEHAHVSGTSMCAHLESRSPILGIMHTHCHPLKSTQNTLHGQRGAMRHARCHSIWATTPIQIFTCRCLR